MSDNLRGITSPDLTKIVRAALQHGWEWMGFTGTTHASILWPATGDKITFGTTPGVASWKTTATEIEKISGVKVWHKGNKKRSRKAVHTSGFSIDAARREQRYSDAGAYIDQLRSDLDRLTAEFRDIANQPSQTRADINRAAWLIRHIRETECYLEDYHQPVDRFDPVST